MIAHIAISQRLLAALHEPGGQVSGSHVEDNLPPGRDAACLPGARIFPWSDWLDSEPREGDADERA